MWRCGTVAHAACMSLALSDFALRTSLAQTEANLMSNFLKTGQGKSILLLERLLDVAVA